MRGLFTLVFLTSAVACQAHQIYSSVNPQIQNSAPRHTITGTVINTVSGEPVQHALVQMMGPNPAVLTGSDGRFQFENVPEGAVNFKVTKPGFFDPLMLPAAQRTQPNQRFTVGPGTNDFQLQLTPRAKISGRLTDEDDEALEGAVVQLLSEQIISGHKQVLPQNAARTNDDGSYLIDDLMPGKYLLLMNGHAASAETSDGPPQVIAPAYYPGAPDLTTAQAIDLQAGQEVHADFHLRAERGFRVAGTIGGYPAGAGLAPMLETSSGQALNLAVNIDLKRGQFVIQAVPRGTYSLRLTAKDVEDHTYDARQDITVDDAEINNLHLQLQRAASIPVSVTHASGRAQGPVGGPMNMGVNVMLAPTEGNMQQQLWAQPNGNPPALVFNNVSEGKYKLNLQTVGNECVESAWFGSVDALRNYIVVGSGGATPPLNLTLSTNCATLAATAANGEAQSGYVLVVSNDTLADPKLAPLSFPPGQLSALRPSTFVLSPGTYQVYAFSSIEGLEYANPEVLRDYTGQTIEPSAGQNENLTLTLNQPKTN